MAPSAPSAEIVPLTIIVVAKRAMAPPPLPPREVAPPAYVEFPPLEPESLVDAPYDEPPLELPPPPAPPAPA
ncbi:MAG TPA: hypothetical protein EYN46_04270 [Candidatus Poseidoniales archaeon]|nr:hypothetical protein [Candidatus Poseidoniales archaeon]